MSIERGREGVPPGAESVEPQPGDSSPGIGEELKAHEEMTHEQWLAEVREDERRDDETVRQEDERNQAILTEEFMRKAEALRALQPTGDLVEDFRAYVAASRGSQFDENKLRPDLLAAIHTGDQEALAQFFAETQGLPESTARNEGAKTYHDELRATAARILETYRDREKQAKMAGSVK